MVSNRIMVAPITTATWAARVMLRPAVAATNRERPGKPARLVIGKRALRERKIVDLAEGCTKKSGLSKATGWKPPKCPHPGRGVNAAPAQARSRGLGPKDAPSAGIKARPELYHRRAWPVGAVSVNLKARCARTGPLGKCSGGGRESGQTAAFRHISETVAQFGIVGSPDLFFDPKFSIPRFSISSS